MRTRKKLIVKNKNIKKRYVGDRLVYRKEEFIKVTYDINLSRPTDMRILFKGLPGRRPIPLPLDTKKIQLNNSEPQDLKNSSLVYETIEEEPVIVLYIDREELDNFFIQQGVEEEYKIFDVTFYQKRRN